MNTDDRMFCSVMNEPPLVSSKYRKDECRQVMIFDAVTMNENIRGKQSQNERVKNKRLNQPTLFVAI